MGIIVSAKKHAISHKNAGVDQILLDEFGTPTDNTNLNATSTRHGLLKKLSNIATEYLNGQGNFSTPPDTGEVNTASNVGTGSGWFKTKNLLDLQFKSLILGSNKLGVTSNTNDLTLDVNEGNLTLGNIGGTLGITKGGTGQTDKTNAFDALSPNTTDGDITIRSGGDNIRLGIGSNGQVLKVVSSLPAWANESAGSSLECDYIEQARQRVGYIEDFFDVGSSPNYATTSNGTGAGFIANDTTDLGTFGVAQAQTGTTTTGRAGVYFGNGTTTHQHIRLGQGITTVEAKIRVPTLSTSSEEFKLLFGFSDDVTSSTPANRAVMEYDRLSSVNWKYGVKDGTTVSEANSTTAVAANTWLRLKVEANAAASLVTYYVDGTSIGTRNTNIPTTELYPIFVMYKSAGTTNRNADIDYLAFQVDLTTPR